MDLTFGLDFGLDFGLGLWLDNTNFLKDEEEMMINLKEDKGNILRDLENCSDSQIREMVPHI